MEITQHIHDLIIRNGKIKALSFFWRFSGKSMKTKIVSEA